MNVTCGVSAILISWPQRRAPCAARERRKPVRYYRYKLLIGKQDTIRLYNGSPQWSSVALFCYGDPPKTVGLEEGLHYAIRGRLVQNFFDYLCRSVVHNRDVFLDAVGNRPAGRGLVTVCNHHSCIDEPVLNGMVDWRHLLRPDLMRWAPAAHNICYTKPLHAWFFSSGKCVPVVRGEGVFQTAMTFLVERLQRGEWVHIFPEGRVTETHERLRHKWGVGRLVWEPARCPLVLPFFHLGMDSVLPTRRPYVPRPGRPVTVLVGRPLELADEVEALRSAGAISRLARRTLTQRIQRELDCLREQAEPLHRRRLSSS